MKKIYILGDDNANWSTSDDKHHLEKAIISLNMAVTSNPFYADIIVSVVWNKLNTWKMIPFLNKTIIAIVSNDFNHQKEIFDRIKKHVDIWVCANTKQMSFLYNNNISNSIVFKNPFYVDEKIFKYLDVTKEEILKLLLPNPVDIHDRVLLGSFQRDSLGCDLTRAKWQKNPKMLINICKQLDPNKYILVLAGPRRHYVINKCDEYNIPYLFLGDINPVRAGSDDLVQNNLSLEKINLLYNLIDIYLVTSTSEGGPKAIIEASLSKTAILSTDVGLAKEYLHKGCICVTEGEFVSAVEGMIAIAQDKYIRFNYKTAISINTFVLYRNRLKSIFGAL
jgi:hypothetical protein